MIAIIDYGAGNITSVFNAVKKVGGKPIITSDPSQLRKAKKIIFPGVGNFGSTMSSLRDLGLIDAIKDCIKKKPYLGICLGLQVLFETSDESPGIPGLGIYKGTVKRFSCKKKIPQIGWNQININKRSGITEGIPDGSYFYFVHSYFVFPKDKGLTLTTTCYCSDYVSGISDGDMHAVQFHPERSGEVGLKMIKNFVK